MFHNDIRKILKEDLSLTLSLINFKTKITTFNEIKLIFSSTTSILITSKIIMT